MTAKDFDKVVDELVSHACKTLKSKAGEYSRDTDRLSCFKRAAGVQQVTPSQALLGMMTKHVISIYDCITSGNKFTEAMAKEKIGDNINYLILLYGLLKEEGFIEPDNK